MAVSASFKQQCPSCEAMVPIRDRSFVGKKVECPKCKDRFVVDPPADDAKANGAGKTNGKGNGKAVPAAQKKRFRDDDADDEDDAPKKGPPPVKGGRKTRDEDDDEDDAPKKKKGTSPLVIGLALGGVGIVVLGVAAVMMMGGGSTPPRPANPGGAPVNIAPPPPDVATTNPEDGGPKENKTGTDEGPKAAQAEVLPPTSEVELARLTNLLPNDTEHVFHPFMKEVLDPASPLRDAAFGDGRLDDDALRDKLGFSPLMIDDLLRAEKFGDRGWRFTVIHLREPIREEAIKAALKLKPAPTLKGQTYYQMGEPNPAFDRLARFSFGVPANLQTLAAKANDRPTFVRVHNRQTLIVADEAPLKDFIQKDGAFPLRTTRVPEKKADAPSDGSSPMPGSGMPPPRVMPPGYSGSSGSSGSSGPSGSSGTTAPPTMPPGSSSSSGTPPMPMGYPPSMAPGGGASLDNTSWEGTESLEGFGKLRFDFSPGNQVRMIDVKETVGGSYTLTGQNITINITGRAQYTGTINGNTLSGSAKAEMASWSWTVTKKEGGGGDSQGAAGGTAVAGGAADSARNEAYLTIDPKLKTLLDKMEARGNSNKDKVIYSAATLMSAAVVDPRAAQAIGVKDYVVRLPRQVWDVSLMLTERRPTITSLGAGLVQKDTRTYQYRSELGCALERDARELHKDLTETAGPQLARFAERMLDHKVEVIKEETPPPMTTNPMGSGSSQPYGSAPPTTAPPGSSSGSQSYQGIPGMSSGMPPTGGQEEKKEKKDDPTVSQVKAALKANTVDFTLDLVLDQAAFSRLHTVATLAGFGLRAELDMAAGKSGRFALARAGKDLGEKGLSERKIAPGQFPPAVFRPEAAKQPWEKEPRHSLSWMVGLLPYLGQEDLYGQLAFGSPWRHPTNWLAGRTLVPQFLDPRYPDAARYVTLPDIAVDMGATHYVGIAGVGLDAPTYGPNDPATAPKRGVLNYERSATLDEVQKGRGTANAILMLQVPHDGPTGVSPWIAGGGATLRGVPEKNSIAPFVLSTDRAGKPIQHGGKRGTFALMTDGSVRFIDQNVSDDVFKAMATVTGPVPENFDPKEVAPVVPDPAALKPAAVAPKTAPAPKAKVEAKAEESSPPAEAKEEKKAAPPEAKEEKKAAPEAKDDANPFEEKKTSWHVAPSLRAENVPVLLLAWDERC